MTAAIGPTIDREQRKQDLLLASQMLRVQAAGAFDEIADRADHLALRVAQARAWLAHPIVRLAGAGLGALLLGMALRRRRAPRGRGTTLSTLMRWGWLGWRVWRASGPALARWREVQAPG